MSVSPPDPHPAGSPHPEAASAPSAADRVPLREKLAYGVGSLGAGFQSGTDERLQLPIFVNLLHVSPALMSTFAVFYRIWDALADLLMGWISDNTRSRWGRRRPYLFVGTLLSALTLPLYWLLNPAWDLSKIIVWMVVGQLVLMVCHTIWNIPFQSLLFELTPSSVERTNVAAMRSYFGKGAALGLSWMWWLTQRPIFNGPDGKPDGLKGAIWVASAIAVLILACGLTTACFTRERFYKAAERTARVALWPNLRMTLSNGPFQKLAIIVLFFTLGTHLNNSFVFFVRLYYVCAGDTRLAAQLAGVGGTIEVITGIAGVPLVQWCARRFGKRATLVGVMGLVSLTGMSTWITNDPAHPYLSLVSNFLSAPALSAIWILIPSLTGDIVDHEELKSGTRREGAFAAVFSWLFKLAISVGTALAGFVVVWVGFDAKLGAAQAGGVLLNIRLILLFGSFFFIGTATVLCAFFPLTTYRIEAIRAELEARRGVI